METNDDRMVKHYMPLAILWRGHKKPQPSTTFPLIASPDLPFHYESQELICNQQD
jgi:hypothetical protein